MVVFCGFLDEKWFETTTKICPKTSYFKPPVFEAIFGFNGPEQAAKKRKSTIFAKKCLEGKAHERSSEGGMAMNNLTSCR